MSTGILSEWSHQLQGGCHKETVINVDANCRVWSQPNDRRALIHRPACTEEWCPKKISSLFFSVYARISLAVSKQSLFSTDSLIYIETIICWLLLFGCAQVWSRPVDRRRTQKELELTPAKDRSTWNGLRVCHLYSHSPISGTE